MYFWSIVKDSTFGIVKFFPEFQNLVKGVSFIDQMAKESTKVQITQK